MSFRRQSKRDANQGEIVRGLEAAGCTVVDLSMVGRGCPDLLVGFRGRTVLLEIKRDEKAASQRTGGKSHNAQTRARQVEWVARWRGGVVLTVTSAESALRAVDYLGPASTDAPGSSDAGGREF